MARWDRLRHSSVSGFPHWCLNSRMPYSVSTSRSSNRTCRFPASGFPADFAVKHAMLLSKRDHHLRRKVGGPQLQVLDAAWSIELRHNPTGVFLVKHRICQVIDFKPFQPSPEWQITTGQGERHPATWSTVCRHTRWPLPDHQPARCRAGRPRHEMPEHSVCNGRIQSVQSNVDYPRAYDSPSSPFTV